VSLRRWMKFNTVGAAGIVVQLAALAVLKGWCRLPYLPATALAVETAVLHNFIWHQRWTWVERTGILRGRLMWGRLARFHLTTGALSIASNLILMGVLVGRFHLHYMLANLLSIAVTSLANFFVSDLFVFREPSNGSRRFSSDNLRSPRASQTTPPVSTSYR
jgi:putative flippase GtrA